MCGESELTLNSPLLRALKSKAGQACDMGPGLLRHLPEAGCGLGAQRLAPIRGEKSLALRRMHNTSGGRFQGSDFLRSQTRRREKRARWKGKEKAFPGIQRPERESDCAGRTLCHPPLHLALPREKALETWPVGHARGRG